MVAGRDWSEARGAKDHVFRYFTDVRTPGGYALLKAAWAILRDPNLAQTLVSAAVGLIVAEKAKQYDPSRSRAPAHGKCPLTSYLKKCVVNAALKEWRNRQKVKVAEPVGPEGPEPTTEEGALAALVSNARVEELRSATPGQVVSYCVAYGKTVLEYRRKLGSTSLNSWAEELAPINELLLEHWLGHAHRAVRAAAGVALGRAGHPLVRYFSLAHLSEKDALLLRQGWYGIGPDGSEELPKRAELGAALGLPMPAKVGAVGKWLHEAAERLEQVFA